MEITNTVIVPDMFMSANWSKENQMADLFTSGLKVGVRGFDTAREYKVEKQVGKALKTALTKTSLKREDIFVQTRISNEEIIKGNIKDEVMRSLDAMGMEYFDCFMFHWPTPPNHYINAWHKLIEVFEDTELVRSIGMCNCRIRHIERIRQECKIMPHVLQVEVTPFWQVKELKSYCDEKGIIMQGFSPLCKMIEPIRKNKILLELADKYGVSIPQIILRWNYQRNIRPISLSQKIERVESNFNIWDFDLNDFDMKMISELDCGYKYHLESATCAGY